MKKLRFLLILIYLISSSKTIAATVDTLDIHSTAMDKTYKTAVVLPASYAKNKENYPVVYLLHGAFGHFKDWLTLTPDKMIVKKLADQYNFIIVMPEGETSSWYLNSPIQKDSQFETYITQEIITKIDKTYRTVNAKKGRVITGLSMGGHGALYLSTRHPDLYCAAGSMSGAFDLKTDHWKLSSGDFANFINKNLNRLLGKDTLTTIYYDNSVVNLAEQMKANGLPLIFDIGVDDFLVEPNRELHRRLLYNHTSHEYTERSGGHTWDYWQNSLPYHMLFFYKTFKINGVTVNN